MSITVITSSADNDANNNSAFISTTSGADNDDDYQKNIFFISTASSADNDDDNGKMSVLDDSTRQDAELCTTMLKRTSRSLIGWYGEGGNGVPPRCVLVVTVRSGPGVLRLLVAVRAGPGVGVLRMEVAVSFPPGG